MTRPCILLVEDNPATRKLYKSTLETEGYQVVEAPDAAAALARMRSSPPDLVLQDLLLPDMSGVELGGRLRDLPGGANIPFIALSGLQRRLSEERMLPTQFDATLFKPVEIARLVEVVREHLPLPGAPPRDAGKVSATRAASHRSGPFPQTVIEDVEEHGPPTPRAPHAVRVIRDLELQVAGLSRRAALKDAQLAILGGVAEALSKHADVDAALGGVLSACLDAGGVGRGAIYRGRCGERLRPSHAVGFAGPSLAEIEALALPGGLVDFAVSSSAEVLSTELPERDRAAVLAGLGVASALILPLSADDGVAGALLLGSIAPETSEEDLLSFARSMSPHFSRALGLIAAFERVRAAEEAAREANRAKDELLVAVSNELRTPLTAILGWASVLRKGANAPGALARGLDSIERNARAQAGIVDEILDVSRILTGKLTLNARIVRLDAIVGAAVDVIAPSADAKGVVLDVAIDPRTGTLSGDPERLKQILWNLVSNAVKFTPRGGRVEVRVGRTGGEHEVQVTDTGMGIIAEILPFVFDRFGFVEGEARKWHGGLGLGLAIVRHLVELHGGSVRAESEGAGKGATFTVRLPALQTLDRDEPAPISSRQGPNEAHASLRQSPLPPSSSRSPPPPPASSRSPLPPASSRSPLPAPASSRQGPPPSPASSRQNPPPSPSRRGRS